MKEQTSWQDSFWGEQGTGFPALQRKLIHSSACSKELSAYFRARAKVESDYAAGLANLNKVSTLKFETGASMGAYLALVHGSAELIARSHQQLVLRWQDEAIAPLERVTEGQQLLGRTFEAEFGALQKNTAKEQATMERLKKEYLAKCAVLTRAIDVASKGQTNDMTRREYEKIQERVIKSKNEVDAAEADYKQAVEKCCQAQDEQDRVFQEFVARIQQSEVDRLAVEKQSLTAAVDAQLELLVTRNQQTLKKVRDGADGVDMAADLNSYLTAYATGPTRSPRPRFQSQFKNNTNSSGRPLSPGGVGSTGNLSEATATSPLVPKSLLARTKSQMQLRMQQASSSSSNSIQDENGKAKLANSSKTLLTKTKQQSEQNLVDSAKQATQSASSLLFNTAPLPKSKSEAKLSIETSAQPPPAEELQQQQSQQPAKASPVSEYVLEFDQEAEVVKSNPLHRGSVMGPSKLVDSGYPATPATAIIPAQLEPVGPPESPPVAQLDAGAPSTVADVSQESIVERPVSTSSAILPIMPLEQGNPQTDASRRVSLVGVYSKSNKHLSKSGGSVNAVAAPPAEPQRLRRSSKILSKQEDNSIVDITAAVTSVKIETDTAAAPATQAESVEHSEASQQQRPHSAVSVNSTPALDKQIVDDDSRPATPATTSTTTAPGRTFPPRVCARRSVKMEGWVNLCDQQHVAAEWTRRWCALEGGYLWVFDTPEDNSKPQGMNKPKSMLSLSKCSVALGVGSVSGWTVPAVQTGDSLDNALTITIGTKRQLVMACASEPEQAEWAQLIAGLNKKK